jgi:hypothetical protein
MFDFWLNEPKWDILLNKKKHKSYFNIKLSTFWVSLRLKLGFQRTFNECFIFTRMTLNGINI